MKTLRIISLTLVLVMAVGFFAACGGSSLIGTWEGEVEGATGSFTFEKDGKGKMSAMGMSIDMTYKTEGDKLTITISVLGMTQDEVYTYSVSGNKLTLTAEDGTKAVLTKK